MLKNHWKNALFLYDFLFLYNMMISGDFKNYPGVPVMAQ